MPVWEVKPECFVKSPISGTRPEKGSLRDHFIHQQVDN
jgi:hypothetical protein